MLEISAYIWLLVAASALVFTPARGANSSQLFAEPYHEGNYSQLTNVVYHMKAALEQEPRLHTRRFTMI